MTPETAIVQLKELERLGGVHPRTNFRVAPDCPLHGVGKGDSYRKQKSANFNPLCICNDARVGAGVKKMRLAAEDWDAEWKTLIAIALSARTRDEVTVLVSEELFSQYTTPHSLAEAEPKDVARIIYPVNFFRNKTKHIIACAKALVLRHSGKPPHDLDKLVELPAVGRKTANVFLSEYGADAIGVDTHVSYISKKLKWTSHTHPQKIELDLQKLFPKNYWSRVNRACVRFGKTYMSRRKKDELLEQLRAMR